MNPNQKTTPLIFLLFTLLFACTNAKSVETDDSLSAMDSTENNDSTVADFDINRYLDSIESIPCVTLLDTVIQNMSIKISCLYAKRLALEATIGNVKSYDTVDYHLFHHCRDMLILYDNQNNNYSLGNFCWFANGKYGIFGVITGWRWSIMAYPLLLNKENQLVFGNNASVNPYYGFVDVEKSRLYLHSGSPSDFIWIETDSGDMEGYFRKFYHYAISNKGLELKKTVRTTNSCIDYDYYEDVQEAVKFYLQARKLKKDCAIKPEWD